VNAASLAGPLLTLLLAPFLFGLINRTKAFFAGRKGPPLLQPYFDLWKLLRKGVVYSQTTGWIFRAGPVVSFCVGLAASFLLPVGGNTAPVSFEGDFLLLVYLFALGRFFTVLAALDTGSSFEGMGASREVFFAALAEPVLLLGLAALVRQTGALSLSGMLRAESARAWIPTALVAISFFVILLVENARLPVDDPNTHLELTMIHEVMVLDHSGPDLALIQYGAALKLWLSGLLLVQVLLPVRIGYVWWDLLTVSAEVLLLGVLIGIVESSMARLRLVRIPQLLAGAGTLAALAIILTVR
jgi:formate hydrogenlyase subunit 4